MSDLHVIHSIDFAYAIDTTPDHALVDVYKLTRDDCTDFPDALSMDKCALLLGKDERMSYPAFLHMLQSVDEFSDYLVLMGYTSYYLRALNDGDATAKALMGKKLLFNVAAYGSDSDRRAVFSMAMTMSDDEPFTVSPRIPYVKSDNADMQAKIAELLCLTIDPTVMEAFSGDLSPELLQELDNETLARACFFFDEETWLDVMGPFLRRLDKKVIETFTNTVITLYTSEYCLLDDASVHEAYQVAISLC